MTNDSGIVSRLADRGRRILRSHRRGSRRGSCNRAGQNHVGNLVPSAIAGRDGEVGGSAGVGDRCGVPSHRADYNRWAVGCDRVAAPRGDVPGRSAAVEGLKTERVSPGQGLERGLRHVDLSYGRVNVSLGLVRMVMQDDSENVTQLAQYPVLVMFNAPKHLAVVGREDHARSMA